LEVGLFLRNFFLGILTLKIDWLAGQAKYLCRMRRILTRFSELLVTNQPLICILGGSCGSDSSQAKADRGNDSGLLGYKMNLTRCK
jgi:hypothetical protein